MFGGNTPGMRQLASKLDQISQRLTSMQGSIGNELAAVAWTGDDATRYRGQWDGEYASAIADAARELANAAVQIRGDADRQDQASAAGGGGGGSW